MDVYAPELSDATLETSPAQDVREAFTALVQKHRERVYRVAVQMTRRHEDADDVVQETFLRAYRSLDTFRSEASVETWIYRIVINVALNHLRHQERSRRVLSLLGIESSQTAPPPSVAVEADEVRQAVDNAVATLPPAQRIVVVLSEMEGLSSGAIADILRIPEGTVRSRLHHARKHLRKRLAPMFSASHQPRTAGDAGHGTSATERTGNVSDLS